MIVGPAWSDHRVATTAATFESLVPDRRLGSTRFRVNDLENVGPLPAPGGDRSVRLVVVGAHLRGQPLNHQLTDLGATFVRSTRTASRYRLYHLAGTHPPKPGLVRDDSGSAILVEEYELLVAAFGAFVDSVPPPLAIGTVELADGSSPKGFVCEPIGVLGAMDITSWGGWVAYLEQA